MLQLEELKLIPAKSEKEVADLGKQLEKLQTDKRKQEEQLSEVMESFKAETGVRSDDSCSVILLPYKCCIRIMHHLWLNNED